MYKFQCLKCGGSYLSYECWVKCRMKIFVHSTYHIEYYDQNIDDTEVLPVESRYICSCCGELPILYGKCIIIEDDLEIYLEMTQEQRAEMQADYEGMEEQEAQFEEHNYINKLFN